MRSDIDENGMLLFAGDDRALDGRTHGDDQVRIDFPAWFQLQPLFEQTMHQWGAGRAADQHHFVDILGNELCVLHRLVDAGQSFLQ